MYTEGFWHIFVTNFEWELRSKYDWKCSKTDRIHTTMCLVLRDVIRVFSERGLPWKNAEFREHFISYFTNFFTKFRIFSRNWILRKSRKRCKISCKKVTTSHTTKCEIFGEKYEIFAKRFPDFAGNSTYNETKDASQKDLRT